MNVLRPGAKVTIHGEIPARVKAVWLREVGGEVIAQYELVWMKEGSRQVEFLDSFEFAPAAEAPMLEVGFA